MPITKFRITTVQHEIVYLAWVGGSWVVGRASWVVRRGSCVVGRASWVVRRGSWVVRRGSCVVGRGAWVARQYFAKKFKTELYHELPKFCTNLFSYATSLLTMATLTKMLVDSYPGSRGLK